MTAGLALRAAAVVFVAALFQAAIFSSFSIYAGTPDVLLVTVISLGLLRGSVPGAVLGFAGGLVVDLLTLETLGLTSLVLTLVGFWAGRYAETTARGRLMPLFLAVGVMTVLAGFFAFALHYMLGDSVVVRHALFTTLWPAVLLNLIVAVPVHALVRTLVGKRTTFQPAGQVELVA
ncbi:MAG: rod shape-determining protein MreD [Actinobacteria bacterium]|nr:rod shape-determining protein MreD [Actinomycetota bacterium]